MFRYMAFIWNPANQRQSEAAVLLGRRLQTKAEWAEVADHPGLRVLCADPRPGSLQPHPLANRAGVVLGSLFERNRSVEDAMACRKAVLGQRQTASIVNSRGKRLIDDYWGNYVALLHDPDASRVWVIKDPAGALPCYTTVFRDVTLVFSCIADCTDLRLLHFSINPSYLKQRVIRGGSASNEALNEVSRVHRGECIEIDPRYHPGQLARQLYWNPLDYAESDSAIEDPERAARALRATVRSCTHTWTNCHDSLLHRLSGGLDSSIVSGCLKDAPAKPRVTTYTYFNPRAADERAWAKLAAAHACCEHVECELGASGIRLDALHRMRPSATPASVLEYVLRSDVDAPLVAARQATAIFTGDGGGSGFCSNASTHAVTEYLHRHGLRPQALRLAAQVALCTHRSTFIVFSHSLRGWLLGFRKRARPLAGRENSRLVNPDVIETLAEGSRYPHPWYRSGQPPWMSIRELDITPASADLYNTACAPDAPDPEMVAPLYSQPAIELFLRIPLYVHFEGGRDRGLARRAFAQEVPKPILRRVRKERTPGLYDELVRRNRELLLELLMDGVLVREGLLNRTAIEAALSDAPLRGSACAEEIFRHLDTELWTRHWTQQASSAVSEPLRLVARARPSR